MTAHRSAKLRRGTQVKLSQAFCSVLSPQHSLLVFLVEKYQLFSMLDMVVLGGELAVPYARNPLYAGLNSRPRVLKLDIWDHFDRTPRNRRSRTSSGPEGSSDK